MRVVDIGESILLFVPKSLERIDLRRAPRGNVARNQGHDDKQQGDQREGRRIGRAHLVE
jgi:hypothetical protein